MATVTTNDKLHDRVERVTRQFLSQERLRLDKQFLRFLPDYGDSIYHALVGDEHITWVGKAPTNMLDMTDKLRIAGIGQYGIGLELPLERKVATPAKEVQFLGGSMESGFRLLNVKLNREFPAWQPYLAPAEVLSTRRDKITNDINRLNRFVLNIMREHKSLGPVLRMWPPLWDILDNDDRRRQGAKPYGAKLPIPGHIATEEEVQQFTATVVRIKMGSR